MEREQCFGCGRKMYKTIAGRGSPSEWRHESSGHRISWTPDKHIAGSTEVLEHAHRWTGITIEGLKHCEFAGCDAEVIDIKPDAHTVVRTDREHREHASRLRGASARGNRPSKAIPEGNASK